MADQADPEQPFVRALRGIYAKHCPQNIPHIPFLLKTCATPEQRVELLRKVRSKYGEADDADDPHANESDGDGGVNSWGNIDEGGRGHDVEGLSAAAAAAGVSLQLAPPCPPDNAVEGEIEEPCTPPQTPSPLKQHRGKASSGGRVGAEAEAEAGVLQRDENGRVLPPASFFANSPSSPGVQSPGSGRRRKKMGLGTGRRGGGDCHSKLHEDAARRRAQLSDATAQKARTEVAECTFSPLLSVMPNDRPRPPRAGKAASEALYSEALAKAARVRAREERRLLSEGHPPTSEGSTEGGRRRGAPTSPSPLPSPAKAKAKAKAAQAAAVAAPGLGSGSGSGSGTGLYHGSGTPPPPPRPPPPP
jgi:hypothetical protein